jgi:hypothetical protein
MFSARALWDRYRKCYLPPLVEREPEHERRKAFYAGLRSLVVILREADKADVSVGGVAVGLIERMGPELDQFERDLQRYPGPAEKAPPGGVDLANLP